MPIEAAGVSETLTVSTTAVGLANELPAAIVEVQTATIRYRVSGLLPTATAGHQAEPGDVIELIDRQQVTQFAAIRRDGVDAVLEITYGQRYVA